VGRNVQLAPATGVTLQNLIQSDAAVNPGSSGGPWFNAAGEVMGFTTVMRKDAENIAFAIPVAALRRRLPGMLDVERRYGLVTGLELADEESPRVITVASDSPAAKAGVRVYDIITKVADQAIATSTDFCLALIGRKPGETLAVKLDRGGKSQEVSLVLASRPKPDGAVLLKKKLGLDAAPLEPAKAKAMGLRVARGMVVARVESSFYEKLAHAPKPGDVLARIGWIRPRDLEHVGMLLENVRPKQPLSLVFLRRDGDVGTRIDINYVVP
jgi:S1-C subfamily serine protease